MGKTARTKTAGKTVADVTSSCRTCHRWKEIKQRMRVAELLAQAASRVEERLKNGELKPTVAEYLKLLQLEQEWEETENQSEGPKEIKVTWVEPEPASKTEG